MAIASLTLYHYPMTRSARARWALLETVGDDFTLDRVELFKGAQYSDAYLARNPNHAVPLLAVTFTDGSTLDMIESAAMVSWLADAFPEKALAPAPGPSAERAEYQQMLYFAGSWMDMMLWQMRVHESLLPESERDARTVARYRDKFATEVEPQLLKRLDSSPFICGERFSAADIVMGHNVRWASVYKLCGDSRFQDYLGRLADRPAYQRAFDDADSFSSANT
ncbi:MAG: glutathione S-transferase family protein [Pseudomonadota bacterium]